MRLFRNSYGKTLINVILSNTEAQAREPESEQSVIAERDERSEAAYTVFGQPEVRIYPRALGRRKQENNADYCQ